MVAGADSAALPAGSDPAARVAALRAAHDGFLSGDGSSSAVRDVVADSWERSMAAGFDPEHDLPPTRLTDEDLRAYRDAHQLATVLPVLRELLGPVTDGEGNLMAVSDAEGRLLWVEGDATARLRAERMNFAAGAAWDEAHAGTNAPGTALAVQHPVQIFAAEHFSRVVQPWTCSAAPIRDPGSGTVIGAVDLTGGPATATAATLALVRATARAAEAELARLWVPRPVAAATLQVLGRDEGVLTICGRQQRLSRKHSELLLLLTEHPNGLSGEQLGAEVYGDEFNPITLRAEMSRLRRLLGDHVLSSRPYRLLTDVEVDAERVLAQVDRGETRVAVHAYAGPMLPLSEAPGVTRARRRLEQRLRAAVLASADPGVLLEWTRLPVGEDDLQVWERLAHVAPYGAVRSHAKARLAELAAEYAVPAQATYLQPRRS